ncbi:tigger transposable element-derived protein 2-like [Nylanderia fulva]|uniref:tigger transposable element-derived protein 2-like n=1 Tax=Nylanderia fulva TaxID=613905 RepID=UPI0010FB09EB|nr:tigger transposable element-derived protein 2-like [Nylanderia fulva]
MRRVAFSQEQPKQTRLSIEERVKIVERLDNGEKGIDLAREYKISRSAITFIKKSREHLIKKRSALIMCQGQTSKKRCTGVENSPLEQALYEWFLERKSIGESVTGTMLQEKAVELNKMLNGTNNFKGTNGFISKFKKRHSIGSSTGETSAGKSVSTFCREFVKYIIDNKIPLDKIYNAKETVFYWKTLPNKTFDTSSENEVSDGESVKNKVTLMVCTNVTGSHKLPLLIVGQDHNCLENIRSSSVIYTKQNNACIDKQLMLTWYQEVFLPEIEAVHSSNIEQCLLLLSDVPNYPSVEELNLISEQCQVICLPSYATSLIPMDHGVIEKLKKIYRKHFLRVILTADTAEDVQKLLKSLDVLKCCHLISDAWDEVMEVVIRNSWKNIFPLYLEEQLDSRLFLSMVNKIPEYDNITLEEIDLWLNSDNDKQECQEVLEQEVLDQEVLDQEVLDQEMLDEELIFAKHGENDEVNQKINQEVEEEEENNECLNDNDFTNDEVTAKSALDSIITFLFWYQTQNQCSPEDRQYIRKFTKLAMDEILSNNK